VCVPLSPLTEKLEIITASQECQKATKKLIGLVLETLSVTNECVYDDWKNNHQTSFLDPPTKLERGVPHHLRWFSNAKPIHKNKAWCNKRFCTAVSSAMEFYDNRRNFMITKAKLKFSALADVKVVKQCTQN